MRDGPPAPSCPAVFGIDHACFVRGMAAAGRGCTAYRCIWRLIIPLGFLPAAVLLSAGAGDAAGPRHGVSPPALAAAAAAASASLDHFVSAGSSPSSPTGSPKAGAFSELDNVDDELPAEGRSAAAEPAAAAEAAAPAGERPHVGALAVAEVGGGRVCKYTGRKTDWVLSIGRSCAMSPASCCQLSAVLRCALRCCTLQNCALDSRRCRVAWSPCWPCTSSL